ncbi:unannotated protein [freshwater metagenome]|uniref:Unannotated protein n=1 Tax=freshwater metagenome TaxID=449393 RepID=A0A6J7FPD1_9ZZZZ|nr:hypothetical protein [Actinomycetota bacterium]
MPSPVFLRPPGQPSKITDPDEIQALAAWIIDPARERPLLVLTTRNDDAEPYFPVHGIQRLVGNAGDVVAISSSRKGRLTRQLAHALPDGLMVFGGAARIYWPTGLVGLDPHEHPLIRADTDPGRDTEKRARLTHRWKQGPHDTIAAVAPATPPAPAWDELELRNAITRAWMDLRPEPDQRTTFPLQPFDVHPDLLEQLRALEPARSPVAAAAAAIISRYVWTQPSPVPVRTERDGVPIVRSHDGAVAWHLPLPGENQSLHYWQPANGPLHLLRIASATPTDLPQIDTGVPTTPQPDPTPARAGRPTPFVLDDQKLVAALTSCDDGMQVAKIRAALQIPEGVSRERVTKALNDAIARGVISRTGQRRATRYTVA